MTKTKIDELKEKIQKDLEKIKQLEQKRNDEIAKLIAKIDLKALDDEQLVGALLYIKEQQNKNQQMMEDWRNAGRKFLKRKSRNKTTASA